MSKPSPTTNPIDPGPNVHYHADELLNALTHGAGLALSIIGGIVLVVTSLSTGDPWRVVGCSLFAMTLIAVYAFSTLSHSAFKPEMIRLFERLDQGSIYLLIVGTFTPFGLAYLREDGWWLVLVAMWTLALGGFFCKVFLSHRLSGVAVWTYLLLGWMPIIAIKPLLERAPFVGLVLVLIGGLCYTFGTAFLVVDNKRFRFHAIWHLMVIAGSTFHYFAVFFFVAQ